MQSLSNKFANLTGSAPRSSDEIYNAASEKASSLFSTPKKSSAARLLSIPAETFSSVAGTVAGTVPGTVPGSVAATEAANSNFFWRYLLIFLVLGFLGFNLTMFLLKPQNKDLSHLYDPLINFYNAQFNSGVKKESKSNPIYSALNKLENIFTTKPVINNIDNKAATPAKTKAKAQEPTPKPEPVKNYKKLPVIPEADDSTSSIQMKPTSKSGFCYIGEDRGFRSCIDVGEGDVCMSGDIFPTEAICINPSLRE